jgi:hypothetical protein
MSQPQTNIDTLHENIKAALAEQFEGVTVDFYGRPGDRIVTPAILLELEDIAAQDPDETGTEQLPVVLNFNAYVVLDYKSGKKQAVKTMAAAVLAFIRGQRWSCQVGAASAVGAFPDVVQGREEAYEVMRVEFAHEALLGADIWAADGEGNMAWKVYLGISPLIGPGNEEHYKLIYEGEDPTPPEEP